MASMVEQQPEVVDAFKVDDGEQEEEVICDDAGDHNSDECLFDQMIGALQDILMDPTFVDLQTDFCLKNCEEFENVTENKLCYTQIFEEYVTLIETFLEQRLAEQIENFSMEELMRQMQEHEDEIPLDVVDVLLSCSDFEEFKSLMLSFKQNETPNFEITGDSLLTAIPNE